MDDLPQSLRRWFVAHFIVDLISAVPVLVAPQLMLGALGWSCVDPVSARLAGAAMLAIGTQSYIGRNESVAVYRAMLNLKIIWSLAAIVGIFVSLAQGAPPAAWGFLAVFIAFSGVWIHYRIRIKQMQTARD